MMSNIQSGINKSQIIGWVLTILLSISGAAGGAILSMNAKMYSNDKRIELVELRVSMLESDKDEWRKSSQDLLAAISEVKGLVIELKATKADRKYLP